MNEQLSIFDYMQSIQPKEPKNHILSVGDKIGRVVLGECVVATIERVEGLPDYPFYRTDKCCYTYEEVLHSIQELRQIADENRKERLKNHEREIINMCSEMLDMTERQRFKILDAVEEKRSDTN